MVYYNIQIFLGAKKTTLIYLLLRSNHVLKYCFNFQGFKLQLTVPIMRAQDTNAIVWKNEIFFPIAALHHGSLNAQAVIEGVLEPATLPQLSTAYESGSTRDQPNYRRLLS